MIVCLWIFGLLIWLRCDMYVKCENPSCANAKYASYDLCIYHMIDKLLTELEALKERVLNLEEKNETTYKMV